MGMNYYRPQFRIQGRQTVDVRKERAHERRVQEFLLKALSEKPEYKKSPRRIAKERAASRRAKREKQKESFSLAQWIEWDVREIANNEFFNTEELVRAEVNRRLVDKLKTSRHWADFAKEHKGENSPSRPKSGN